jgi:hypothetical protein
VTLSEADGVRLFWQVWRVKLPIAGPEGDVQHPSKGRRAVSVNSAPPGAGLGCAGATRDCLIRLAARCTPDAGMASLGLPKEEPEEDS